MLNEEKPRISKEETVEKMNATLYALKKELTTMSEEHVAEFVGISRNGNG